MKMLTSTLLLLVAVTGCAKMKEKMGEMKDNVQKSTSNAQAKYNSEVNKRMNPDGTPAQDPGPPSGADGGAGTQNAVAGGAAATTATQSGYAQGSDGSASGGDGADNGGAGSDPGMAAGDGSDGSLSLGSDPGASDGSAGSAAVGYVPDCSKPNNAPEMIDTTGTERWQWTDAQKGAFMRFRMTSDMEMTYDVKDATDKLVLIETRTTMGGKLVSCSLDWQPRLFKKVEVAETEKVDYETKTTDLPDEVVDVGGKSVNCKVRRVWTKFAGNESTSVIWTSTEVPGEMVKTATETDKGLETVYQLMEWRS